MLRKWSMLVVMLLVAPMLAFGQSTGKIAGKVTEGATGEGLPGVNVVLQGTTYGSITDVDGNYFVIGVPVGTYNVQASFVGFTTEVVTGVQVSSGYTKEINFALADGGLELDQVVVEYERPLIQKDAVGNPKIVSGEELVNLPVRGAAAVAKIQAGVVARDEGSGSLNIRGGRGSEVSYYIDGIKVIGTTNIPQSAIQEQEIIVGNISARYGDAMSGIINITTKSGSTKYFGSIEGITSQSLDDFGYNLVSATVGGPIASDKLNFFLSAEFTDQADSNPRSVGFLELPDNVLADMQGAPQAFRGMDADGNEVLIPVPATLGDNAGILSDADGHFLVDDGVITFDDGTTITIPEGVEASSIDFENFAFRSQDIDESNFTENLKKPGAGSTDLALSGNVTLGLLDNGRLRLGGRYITGQFDGLSSFDAIFAPENLRRTDRDEFGVFGTWTQHLSNSTFYQLQADFSDRFSETYDQRFGAGFEDLLKYGDVDGQDEFATLRGYKGAPQLTPQTDAAGDTTGWFQRYPNQYSDSNGPAFSNLLNLVNGVGGRFNGYSKAARTQFRLSGSATTQVGINQLEFGAEYETRTFRSWSITASRLAGYFADGNPESIDPNDPDQNPLGYDSYDAIPASILSNFAGGTGYDLYGRNEVDTENFDGVVNTDKNKALADFAQAPYQPIYYGGYVQNKIEFRDIVMNLGLRVDIFDNNTRVLTDAFARRPIERASSLSDRPSNVGGDFAVYKNDQDAVIGYRDLDGRFYDVNGQQVQAGEILLIGAPTQTSNTIDASMFEDYEPSVTAMPRIGVSFPVTDRALFFASYGIVSQRPSTNSFQSLGGFTGTGRINNNNLDPEKTTKYELGFRTRLGERSALTISGFFHQIDNLIQLRDIATAFPNAYSTYENVDFGTVKGAEFGFDLRRTNNLQANVNYTLSFADGTGSSSTTTSTIVWIDETPPNFISPLDFDQRHKMNLSLDYRLGKGEGPKVGGTSILENFGINVLATAGSGFPYTGISDPFAVNASRAPFPSGGVNQNRVPWTNRIDLKVDRRIPLGGVNLTASLWVQNVLNTDNAQFVWRGSGLPGDDGFRSTPEGESFINDSPAATNSLYTFRNALPGNFGLPRLTRLGLRMDF